MTQLTLFIFAIICASVSGFPLVENEGCSIKTNSDFTYQHPLILNPTNNEFIYPNVKNGINFSKGQNLRLSCPGSGNKIQIAKTQEATITCVSNKTFTVNGSNRLFKELRCEQYPEAIAKRTGKKCSVKYTEIQIGFNTNKGFVPIMTNCLDEATKNTLYSKFNLSKMVKSQQYNAPRPNGFKDGGLYDDVNPKVSTLYEKRSQRTAFQQILKSTDLAQKYISMDTDFYLSRGHLTAKADYIYASQQRATFFYVNVAPQWQTFNGNNWNEVEKSSRNYANKRKLDLEIYTGVYGQATLPDNRNISQNLSIYIDKNNKQLLTVPEIYWKILHDPASKKGVVLIGHNNPYNKNVKNVCKDISGKLNWLSWDAKNVTAGVSYSCEFAEFKKIVSYLPDIPITNLLT